jgi:hypothetical protein
MSYHDVPLQQEVTVGEFIAFLEQFDRGQVLPIYLRGEDRTEWVGLYAEDPGEPGYPPYPMLVVSFTENGE